MAVEDGAVCLEWKLDLSAQHAERLLWSIDQALKACRWTLEDITAFGVGLGPGSFTGLRIGLTTARTLGWALKRPVLGLSSLAVLAKPVAQAAQLKSGSALVVVATDASKGEFFGLWGLAKSVSDCLVDHEGELPGYWKSGVKEAALTPEALSALCKKKKAPSIFVGGEVAERYPEWVKTLGSPKGVHVIPGGIRPLDLGLSFWQAHQIGLARPALSIRPRYLRASDAELKLRAGMLQRPLEFLDPHAILNA